MSFQEGQSDRIATLGTMEGLVEERSPHAYVVVWSYYLKRFGPSSPNGVVGRM